MNDDDAAPDLRQYLAILGRRKALVVVVALAVTAVAVVLALLQSPTYSASAHVLREAQPVDPLTERTPNAAQAQRELNNEIRELESTIVREAVAKAYTGPLPVTAVKGSVVASDADVIRVSASGGDPEDVATLVNTYVDTYLKFRTEQQVARVAETETVLRQKRDQLKAQVDAAPLDLSLQSQLSFYQEQLDKVDVTRDLAGAGSLRVLSPAEVPSGPVSPKPLRNAVLGLAIGLMLGVGAAFARDHLDDTLRDKATLETESQLPTLGVIPRLPSVKGAPKSEVVTISEHSSSAAEAYRTLRTSVKFVSLEDGCKVFQITSPSAAEGKTLTAMNLAVALTQAGDRTIVVGCDLRRPRLDTLAHAHPGPGLTSVLVGDAELHEAIERHAELPLDILRTGPLPPDPSEVLSSARTKALVAALRGAYDVVILDCPPLLPVSDALIVAAYSDATLLVVSEGETSRRSLARALELLRQVNAPLRGTILNGAKGTEGYGYGYRYAYAQSPAEAAAPQATGPAAAPAPASAPEPVSVPANGDRPQWPDR